MRTEEHFVIRIPRRWVLPGILAVLAVLVLGITAIRAQKVQQDYKDKLDIAQESGGIGVATSADGKYVYVAGPQGIAVSDNFGKVGSWTQTARLK